MGWSVLSKVQFEPNSPFFLVAISAMNVNQEDFESALQDAELEQLSDEFDEAEGEAEEQDQKDLIIAELERERNEFKDQMLRTLAELQNFRRRAVQEKEDLRKTASEGLVIDLLPVLDNFERALASLHTGSTVESAVEGLKMMERQMRGVLSRANLVRIESLGRPFDPELHEAIGTTSAEGKAPGTIVEEIEPGYRLGDRVIRPARVRVSA